MKHYELTVGLEVHAELKTDSKIFCSCSTAFGGEPNSRCCPVCMGLPGALPVLNRRAVELAVLAGLATDCRIERYSEFDRKHYFYPDLPKAYQITQYAHPICREGALKIEGEWGVKQIGITRIHLEEDAGKLVHEGETTGIDFNRCGVGLIEIVSEPDIGSSAEAVAYLKALRSRLLFAGVSDCRMQEGSLRCDVNLSVREVGERGLGTRTEIKNLNSFRFVAAAIEQEYARQVEVLEAGGVIAQETRRFDPATCKTYPMRQKENAADYLYFPEPDLLPLLLEQGEIEALAATMPELPDARRARYRREYGIDGGDADALLADPLLANYFEEAAEQSKYPKTVVNLLLTELLRLSDGEAFSTPIAPSHLGELAELLGEERINSPTAKRLLSRMADEGSPAAIAEREGLWQINDEQTLRAAVREVLAADPKSVAAYLGGKTNAAKALIGRVMAKTEGRANPVLVNRLLGEALSQLHPS